MITADDVARAVVAACRETGEDPLTLATAYTMKARHFAYHALLNVFPDIGRTAMARMLGVPKPGFFHRTSMWFVVGQGPHKNRRADWFTDAALGRVIDAVRPSQGGLSKKPASKMVEEINITESRGGVEGHAYEPKGRGMQAVDEACKRASADSGDQKHPYGAGVEPGPRDAPPPARYGLKRELEEMLAQAVRNTVKLSKNNRGG